MKKLVTRSLLVLAILPATGCRSSGDSPRDRPIASAEALYARHCVSCHEANGAGKPGAYPPLGGSPWLVDDPETPIRVVLLGLGGPIEVQGKTYDSVMAGLGVILGDEEVARLVSYARASFGNHAAAVSVADVKRVRAALGHRTTPWKGGAELEAARR